MRTTNTAPVSTDDIVAFGKSLGLVDKNEWLHSIARVLEESSDAQTFPTFKTIQLGTGLKSAKDFQRALKENHCHVSDWAEGLLKKMPVEKHPTTVELVVVSVVDLGFPNGATRRQIYESGKKLGLEPCPAEVGPQLRLQYKDQPIGEWLYVAMEPILDSDGALSVFRVGRRDDGTWLRSIYGYPEDFWDADGRFVFVSGK